MRSISALCLFLLVALTLPARAALTFPPQWVHGAPAEDALQVHEAAPGFWILRQSKRSHFEAPFLYLIAGEERALLLDTGAAPEDGSKLPLRKAIDGLLDRWSQQHPRCLELVVAHSHSHRDHVAGDDQFRDRPRTRVVGTSPADVAAFFGLTRWPDGDASFDLGGRGLLVFPLPGHEPSHIALFDPATRTLLSGDSLYPGLLTVRNLDEYRASVARLAQFARQHRIEQILGAHIEMTATPRAMYPLGTRYQPGEHAIALAPASIDELARTVQDAGDFHHDIARDDFILGRISAPSQDAPSIHGMLLVGTRSLYLSHLPLFHPPHDYQAIVEVELAPGALEQYRLDAMRHPESLYTVAPTQSAVLDQLIKEDSSFAVDLYRGHFERGGIPILRDAMARVRRVVYFEHFTPGSAPDPKKWIAFGREGEAFLAHRIEGPPDRDMVVKLDKPAAPEGDTVHDDQGSPVSVGTLIGGAKVQRVIYSESEELSR